MIDGFPILTAITMMPLAGGLLILAVSSAIGSSTAESDGMKTLTAGLVISIATFLVSVVALMAYRPGVEGYQLVEAVPWYGTVQYKMGVDGLSILLVVLTTLLMPFCFLASYGSVKTRVTEYVVAFLVLETFIIGAFCALDILLFYIFFEAGLIPMFIIIGVWGGVNRIYASFKFFLYTLLGSLFMLAAVVYMILEAGSSDFELLEQTDFVPGAQTWLWLAFFASFAVKLPMFPVHTWLPDAHVQAPTAGSVLLAGILLKLGGYGFLRFSLPMFPDASAYFQPFMFTLSVVAIVYASLVAWRQTDMKKLVAYSSVAHMGFVTLGVFSFTEIGVQGAVFQMLSHGLISGALFLIVGVIYDRAHTREIAAFGGLAGKMPVYAALFMLFSMANVGLPGTSGFVGEILTMIGAFQASTWAAFGAALGVIFSAVYMLTLYRRAVFGQMNPELEAKVSRGEVVMSDVNGRELVCLLPLAFGVILLGVKPDLIFDITEGASQRVLVLMGAG
ncbi:MAG: NADH-quinone oxidoreductase subunit M [Pseudomonadota bacterium]